MTLIREALQRAALSLYMLPLFLSLVDSATRNGKLRMAHVVYRHGIRSPIHFYPADKYQEKHWINGLGHLTQKGMYLEYELGQFFKYRYVRTKFINTSYLHKEVYIRSSDSPRCIQSAQAQLAGLYPPEGWQVWNDKIPWQPVPVHTVPLYDDPLLRPYTKCPRIQSPDPEIGIWRGREVSAPYLADVEKNQDLLDEVDLIANFSKGLGITLNYDNLWWIQDCIRSEEAEGFLPLVPVWKPDLRKRMFKLADRIFGDRWKGDDEMGRVTGGPLLARMIKHMKLWSEGKRKIKDVDSGKNLDLFKFNLYSGHDQSLLALACSLNIHIEIPLFAASIMVELYESPDIGWYVEVHYRNDKNLTHFTKLQLKGCNFQCPLDKFIELTKNRVSVDRDKECWYTGRGGGEKVVFSTPPYLKVLLGVFIALSLVLLTVIVLLCYNNSKSSSSRRHEVNSDGVPLRDHADSSS